LTPTKSNWSECHGIEFEMVNEIYTILTEALEFYASRNVYERLTQFPGDNEAVECSDIAVEALARSRAALVTSAPKPSTVGRSNIITKAILEERRGQLRRDLISDKAQYKELIEELKEIEAYLDETRGPE